MNAELATIIAAVIGAIATIIVTIVQLREKGKEKRNENENSQAVLIQTSVEQAKTGNSKKDYLKDVLESKSICCGVVKHPPLCNFEWDKGSLSFSGLYVEICKQVGQNNGFSLKFVPVDWSDIPNRVFTEMGLDLVLSVFETSERARINDFAACFHKVSVVGITQGKGSKVNGVEDLYRDDVRIVVTKGEAGWEYVTRELKVPRHRLIVVENSDITEMMHYVTSNRVDVAICDEVSCYDYVNQDPEAKIVFHDEEVYVCKNCIMVPKDQPDFKNWVSREFSKARNMPKLRALESEILSDPRKLIRRHL